MAIIDKRRMSAETTVQAHILGGQVEGKVALMFDDMISTAGSITGAAKVLHEHGVKEIHVAATHAVLCGPAIERLKAANLASLVVTDSIPLRRRPNPAANAGPQRRPAAGRGDQADPPQRIGQPAVSIALRTDVILPASEAPAICRRLGHNEPVSPRLGLEVRPNRAQLGVCLASAPANLRRLMVRAMSELLQVEKRKSTASGTTSGCAAQASCRPSSTATAKSR